MKKLILMIALFAPLTMFAQKFGHLDSQALLSTLPEAIAAQNELKIMGEKYEQEIQAMQQELQKQMDEYDKTKSTLNATKQQEKETELQQMYEKIQQAATQNQQHFNKAKQEKLSPILQKVRDAIQAVGKEGGYTYIFETGAALYVGTSSTDVTDAVKAKLK
ncbi:MAG: OmpH family outer membrane protein [Prevotella sp.]|nr:OmpH family outer membrane protein [Prevotella sp.]